MRRRKSTGHEAGSGMIARIGKRVILHGKLSYEIFEISLDRYRLEIYGDLEFNEVMHPDSKLFEMHICPILGQRAMFSVFFGSTPVEIKAIKLFRELLSRYLDTLKTENEIPGIIRESITEYLPVLEEYSNAKSMLDQLIEAVHNIDLEKPDEVEKLALALYALDVKIACKTKVLIRE